MKLNVAAELRQPGKTSEYHGTVPMEPVEYLGRSIEFAAPFILDVTYSFDGSGFNVTGSISTALKSECAKCTKPFSEPFSFEFSERFTKNPAEDDECYGYQGEELDLRQMVLDNFLLNVPMYSLCSENCKGLCPVCGCNLNTTQCRCKPEEAKNPFSKLSALLNDDKEV